MLNHPHRIARVLALLPVLFFCGCDSSLTISTSGANLTISPSTGRVNKSGDTQSFTVTGLGYPVSTTVGGTCPAGSWSGTTYTTGPITANCLVSFSAVYTITASSSIATFTPSSAQTALYGSTQTYSVVTPPGYTDTESSVGGTCPVGSWNGTNYTTGSIIDSCTVIFTPSLSFTNLTTTQGLRSNEVWAVFISGSTLYVASSGGISISTNGGASFTNPADLDLGSPLVTSLLVSGNTIYAATNGGLSLSTNGAASFSNYTSCPGEGSGFASSVVVSGNTLYAAMNGCLSISTNGGSIYTDTLKGEGVNMLALSGSTLYAASANGIYYTTDGGNSFKDITTSQGLGNNYVNSIAVSGSNIYAGTTEGLSISTDGGASFTNTSPVAGSSGDTTSIAVSGNSIYAAVEGCLAISNDGGNSYIQKFCGDGVTSVTVSGSTLYVCTAEGLEIAQ